MGIGDWGLGIGDWGLGSGHNSRLLDTECPETKPPPPIKNHTYTSKNIDNVGIGDWGLGIGDWGLGPIPNPQSPIPNPHPHNNLFKIK